MKVQVVHNLADVADIPEDRNKAIVTRDGAKLVTVSIVGSSPMASIIGTMTGVLNVLAGIGTTELADKIVYLVPGSLVTNLSEHRFTVVMGISGITDLEDRLKAMPQNILNNGVAPVSVGSNNTAPTAMEAVV